MIQRYLKTILGVFLIPAAIGVFRSFCGIFPLIGLDGNVLHIFERGALLYALFHVIVFRPVYIYVIGHEVVHVLATWLCGGQVLSFDISRGGGSVATSKTNIFIELSPYFVPIYTLLLGPVFMILRALGRQASLTSVAFVLLVGITLAFHFIMTAEVIKMKQPDIARSGFLFSIVFIFICNLIVVAGVFSMMFDAISFVSFIKSAVHLSAGVYMWLYIRLVQLII